MGFPIELNGIQSIAHMKPEFPAMEIVENLKVAMEKFRTICEELGHNPKTKPEEVITQNEQVFFLC